MPGFIYFVPGVSAPQKAHEVLQNAGAAHAVYEGVAFTPTGKGPGGVGGALLASGPASYRPEAQTWRKAPKQDYWLGLPNEQVRPADLQRPSMLDGHMVTLGDGQEWLIPVVRRHLRVDGQIGWHIALPTSRSIDDEGNWQAGEVVARHRALWDEVVRVDDIISRGITDESAFAELDLKRESDLVVRAIATNYRIGGLEASMLGLVTSEVIMPVINALRDAETLKVLLEKKAPAPGVACISPGV